MDPIIKVLVLKSGSKVLVTQIKEIPSELGEPDCQLTDPVEFKEESLLKYMYSITIENCRQPGYWTEKIVDCFASKSIPLFWGDDAVDDHFDKRLYPS